MISTDDVMVDRKRGESPPSLLLPHGSNPTKSKPVCLSV